MRTLALVLCAASAAASVARESVEAQRRARAGVKLFRSLLAADEQIDRKTDDAGRLLIVFVHAGDAPAAEALAAVLLQGRGAGEPAAVRGLPLRVELTDDATLSAYAQSAPAGVFVAQPPRDGQLDELIRFGIEHGVIVYSPFEGHVEKGVLGGLFVGAQVQPYLNRRTLEASGISIKGFFLKVTKIHE